MENFRMRFQAKLVAIVELIFTGIGIAILAIGLIALILTLFVEKPSHRGAIIGIIVILVVAGVIQAIQFWAECCLLKACNKATTPKEALRNARNWNIVTCIFFTLFILGCLITLSQGSTFGQYGHGYNSWGMLIAFVWRIYTLCVVSIYITEISDRVSTGPVKV